MSKSTSTQTTQQSEDTASSSSCKFRVYLTSPQHDLISHYLYWVQKFRNEAVDFCQTRRKARSIWMATHPDSPDALPEELAGSDVTAASKWLTMRLEQARVDVATKWNITAPKKELRAHVHHVWVNLQNNKQDDKQEEKKDDKKDDKQEEKLEEKLEDIPDAWLLTIPRTVFDQCLQDMKKTYNKAIKDRTFNKANPSKKTKPAGFPQFQKHSYPYSVRFQISTQQNKTYVDSWNDAYANKRKQIYIPSLGVVTFRDKQYVPAVPPEMITVSRNAAGQFHVSFVNKDPHSKTNARLRDANTHALPMEHMFDPTTGDVIMVPVARGNDVGLKTLGTYSQAIVIQQQEETKKEARRVRFFKRQEKHLRYANKSVSRKKRGSTRWKKAKEKQGRLHTKTTNQRHDYLKKEAQLLVKHAAIVCLEDLNLSFMLKNKHLAQSAHDAALGAFKQYIRWEARKLGHLVLECGRFDATSKTCHKCGRYHKDLKLNDRTWECPNCNMLHDRDENAAINIRQMALQKAIKTLQASGKDVGMLSPYPLHQDLTAFIKRGGLTSLLALQCVNESLTDEALLSPKHPSHACKEQA